MLVHKLLAISR